MDKIKLLKLLLRVFLTLLIILIASPFVFLYLTFHVNKYSKKDYYFSQDICNNLYVERFRVVNGGVYGSNEVSTYLTDSANFRIYTGTYFEDEENMSYECNGDSILVCKISVEHSVKFEAVSNKTYSIDLLKRNHKFE